MVPFRTISCIGEAYHFHIGHNEVFLEYFNEMKGSRATQQKLEDKCAIVSTLPTWHNMAGKCSVPGSELFSQPLTRRQELFDR